MDVISCMTVSLYQTQPNEWWTLLFNLLGSHYCFLHIESLRLAPHHSPSITHLHWLCPSHTVTLTDPQPPLSHICTGFVLPIQSLWLTHNLLHHTCTVVLPIIIILVCQMHCYMFDTWGFPVTVQCSWKTACNWLDALDLLCNILDALLPFG